MKVALLLCAMSVPAWAQGGGPTAACGSFGVDYKVNLNQPQPVETPDAGKARVYFIHDAGTFTAHPLAYPTTKMAMDGAWVGANHGDSAFSLSVDPGEHHLCAMLQSSFVSNRVELAHFAAEAGKTYFFRTRLLLSRDVELLELLPIDSDEGAYLVGSFEVSVSHPKK
jgi:hypothetical protein